MSKAFFEYTERAPRDAYYTRDKDAKACVDFVEKFESVDYTIEPFAGTGSFSKYLATKGYCAAYDIAPEDSTIEKQDTLDPTYSWEDRLCITNMPFLLKEEVIKKALQYKDHFWTIASQGILNGKGKWEVDKVLMFEYGGWQIPRSYLLFNSPHTPENVVKQIYCMFVRVSKPGAYKLGREQKILTEQWRVAANKVITLDNRFYVRDRSGKIREAY